MDTTAYEWTDTVNGLRRVTQTIDNSIKWGLTDTAGQILLPLTYDYISPPINNQLFRVFIGLFEWEEYDEETETLFYDCICDQKSWNGDRYEATLGKGCWGLVNRNNEAVIPIQFNALHFYSDDIFIVNEHGSRIIKWYCGDDKEWNWSVVGGRWRAINANNATLVEMNTAQQQFEFYTLLNKLQAWDMKYKAQTIQPAFKDE